MSPRDERGVAQAGGSVSDETGRPRATAFETILGACYISWGPGGVSELRLPDPADGLRRAPESLIEGGRARLPDGRGEPQPSDGGEESPPAAFVSLDRAPGWLRGAVERISGHLDGGLDDLLDVPLRFPDAATAFERAIWEATREIPPAVTISYGELACEAGHPGAARAAGRALGRCPIALLVPAHRVIAAGGRIGGWTGPGGIATKLRLLALEGVGL